MDLGHVRNMLKVGWQEYTPPATDSSQFPANTTDMARNHSDHIYADLWIITDFILISGMPQSFQ